MEQRVQNLAERLAAVEAQLKDGKEDRTEMKEALMTQNDKLTELINKVSKWEGKFGGVLFIIGCLGAFFSGLLQFIKNWITTFGVPGK